MNSPPSETAKQFQLDAENETLAWTDTLFIFTDVDAAKSGDVSFNTILHLYAIPTDFSFQFVMTDCSWFLNNEVIEYVDFKKNEIITLFFCYIYSNNISLLYTAWVVSWSQAYALLRIRTDTHLKTYLTLNSTVFCFFMSMEP